MSIIVRMVCKGRFELVNGVKQDYVSKEVLENTSDLIKNEKEKLINYHILDLSGNFITRIENDSLSFYFKHITELYMINNELKEMPAEFNQLQSLEKLYLSKNKIQSIDNIDKLVCLKVLDLRANRITDCSILKYNNQLQYLSLSNNLLANVESIPQLNSLDSLFLFANQITALNETLELLGSRTPNLTKLLLSANPATPLNRSTQEIQQYRQQTKSKLIKLSILDWQPFC
ncbi:hypothetical protein PPL_05024 [Heterostelium album PN500]|uniref:Uncharacterized protein n=1 Tax=Heterostelium pallidum (strain ATCC 26659 / Pp 5 / PN500) TaxID=670386 RepID=D3B980_HETP5|nr:hypothetical protein PPL_05024 [Heterostelium album PN500]EFA82119.1 hypothetical protein PPL_05024 [Heterostelium album PN500]|eukprot:XP_020434236.1 hypothetical protein PPL_05024 [Heterostelium album PN500]